MGNPRYKELKWEGNLYTENYKINEILIKQKFAWLMDCEFENARLEILKDTLIWNAGTFFNGLLEYIVIRDGEFKAGVINNGVLYNGTYRNFLIKNGLVFNGKFFNCNMLSGEIRGGEFLECNVAEEVKRATQIKENLITKFDKFTK